MSTVEGAGKREEGEYGRAAKRLKTEERETEAVEREEGEEELEEGEDSDSGSLPGNGEASVDNRARWSASQYGAGRRVRRAKILSNVTLQHHRRRARACARASVCLLPLSSLQWARISKLSHTRGPWCQRRPITTCKQNKEHTTNDVFNL